MNITKSYILFSGFIACLLVIFCAIAIQQKNKCFSFKVDVNGNLGVEINCSEMNTNCKSLLEI